MRLIIKHKVNTTKTRYPLYGHLLDSSFHGLVRLDLLFPNIPSKHTRLDTKNAEFKIFEPGGRQHMKPEVLLGTSTIFSLKQEE